MTAIKGLLISIMMLPFLELAAFLAVATQIGFGWTFLLLLATSIAGLVVVRHSFSQFTSPLRVALAEGNIRSIHYSGPRSLILLGGFLLLIPGFITDLAGFLLLLTMFWRSLTTGKKVRADGVLELEPEQWHRVPDPQLPPDRDTSRFG
jgi:UPF0716 protein FxsA